MKRLEAREVEVHEEELLDLAVSETPRRLEGLAVGRIVAFAEDGAPLCAHPHDAGTHVARTMTPLAASDVGSEVVLGFENGDPSRPIVMGKLLAPARPPAAQVDGQRVVLEAGREIVLRCGKASLTLTRSGKIVLRGTHLLSRSSGLNRIQGAAVSIN